MTDNIKLTGHTKFSGCGAKMGPALLDRALCNLEQANFPELLVDYTGADDAGVWKINEDTALVQTVDFFPPIVDHPYTFGRIAGANALSDIYAMGGRPITALSIVAFPVEKVDIEVLRSIMAGALAALGEAGAALVGGHSIKDDELKFGLAVTGLVHPDAALRNNSPKAGDIVLVTKPIGTGCINTALKAGRASNESIGAANRSMETLNKQAAEILARYSISACTDVTGFGLLGHACEMIAGSGTGMQIRLKDVETLPGTKEYIAAGLVPRGTYATREYREKWIDKTENLNEDILNLLFDPQTSGGLMAAVRPEEAPDLLDKMRKARIQAYAIGEILPGREAIGVVI